ncbi:MAG: DNA recombination protein RmuC [Myxococcota bacterium]|nr:DNA recombination protein RmuC [Myxococcota bacterium]
MLVAVLIASVVTLAVVVAVLLRQVASHQGTADRFAVIERAQERLERGLREDLARGRDDASRTSQQVREDVRVSLTTLANGLQTRFAEASQHIVQLTSLVDERMRTMQEDNGLRLEQMRATVDEKLQGTLEKRLGESFKLVSERLEQVHKGLGEMQNLAAGVGDLRKVLTNVKTRGTWGEVQLGNLLEQIMTPEQYGTNVATVPGSRERVEFAIRMPGQDDTTWLPIDSKFPQEDYQRLVEASERGDAAGVEQSTKALEACAKRCAAAIRDKYVMSPHTTDFGLMFVPTEGLYAELVRRPGLADVLQRDYRVLLVGPMTLAALLNSLQMGFRTLALQKRSSEVWTVLGAVKSEFGRFSDVLTKVQKKLTEASNTIDDAAVRTRAMEKTLKNVDQLPARDATSILGLPELREREAKVAFVHGAPNQRVSQPQSSQTQLRLTSE